MRRQSKSKSPEAAAIEIDGISDKPGHLIRLVHQKSVAIFENAFSDFNVTVGQQLVLVALLKHPNLDLSSLAQLVTWDRSTTGDVVSRLARRGLVKVTPSSEDLRVKLISLSPSGRALLMKMAPAIRRSQQEMLSALEPQERLELIRLMRKIVGRGGIEKGIPAGQLARNPLVHRPVGLLGSKTAIGALVQRRLTELGAEVVALPDDHLPRSNGTAHRRSASEGRLETLLPDGCRLLVYCRGWPQSAENGDRTAVAMDLTREFNVLGELLDQDTGDLHVVIVLSLMPDQEPGHMETAAGLKRAFLYFASRLAAKSRKSKATVATVITGSLQKACTKGRRPSPADVLAALEEAADAVLFAAQMAPKIQTQIVVDQIPELG